MSAGLFREPGHEYVQLSDPARRTRSAMEPLRSPLLLLAAILLIGFSWGRWNAPLAAWLGPALLIRFYRDRPAGRGYLLLLPACIVSSAIAWWQIFPAPISWVLYAIFGLMFSLPYVADRLLHARLNRFVGTLVFPLASTAWEFANVLTNPIGSWGAAAYTQYGNLPLMQLVSITGLPGITFLMGWFASAVNSAWENRSHGREMGRSLTTFAAVLAAVLVFGTVRLAASGVNGGTVRVAGITAEPVRPVLIHWMEDMPAPADARVEVERIRSGYIAATVREARAGAKVIVWPEVAGLGFAADEPELISRAQKVAMEESIFLAVPLFTLYPGEDRPTENKLLVIGPTGEVELEHYKYGGSFLEGTRPGDRQLRTVEAPFGLVSGVLCWDLDFPAVIRQAGQAGVGLMLVPSNDWAEVTPVHGTMAAFRAIENGFSVFRQTDHGLSIAFDPYGRVLAQMNHFTTTDRTMVAQLPIGLVPTIYALIGDWFGVLNLAGFAIVLVWGLVARNPGKPDLLGTAH